MNKLLIIIFLLVISISCKNTNQKLETKEEINKKTLENDEQIILKSDKYTNCFSKDDIDALKQHYRDLHKSIKLGVKYDFSKSPVQYTSSQKESILSIFKDKYCKGRELELSNDCIKMISFEIDCREIIVIDDEDEEHLREEYYRYELLKKDGNIFVSKIDGAG